MTPLQVDRVSKWFGPVIGLNDVSATLAGGVTALLGPNGAGKSTFLKTVTGQYKPDLGTVRVFGRSPLDHRARRQFGYCPDLDAFYEDMTGRRFVRTMARLDGFARAAAADRTEAVLETVGMTGRADVKLRGCSKGMRQRIKLAQALLTDPPLLILDEPLSGLDPVGRGELTTLFRRWADAGRTLLVSSHVLAEVERIADRVLLLGQGRVLASGTWDEVAGFLGGVPRQYLLAGVDVRRTVADLLERVPLTSVRFDTADQATVETADADGLAAAVTALAVAGAEVTRLEPAAQWADVLYRAAEKGDLR